MTPASTPADDSPDDERLVPEDVMPRGDLPAMRVRDLPEAVPLRRMIGPGIILAGLALGSGEFVIWPYITYRSGFVFFWACVLGVVTQYFINMEVTRWTLATGESAVTGFCRLSRHWAWVFLLLNIIPWIIPAWATGAAEVAGWLFNPDAIDVAGTKLTKVLTIASLVGCASVLTLGPVVYETVERLQMVLVTAIVALVVLLSFMLVRWDAVAAMAGGVLSVGDLPPIGDGPNDLSVTMLLGALAFAGAGGTLNLGQSNFIKDKGYGMGRFIGRITSPVTGQAEAVTETGYHFEPTEANLRRWRSWWRAAGAEHFLTFFLTCIVCLVLLTLISYSIFYDGQTGQLRAEAEQYGQGMQFIRGEAVEINQAIGPWARSAFFLMGIAILLTTEIGVLDACSRISSDLVKINWLRDNPHFSEGRLYFYFLWGSVLVGCFIALYGVSEVEASATGALRLFKMTSALNGGVMFLYCGILLYLNRFRLPPAVRMSWARALVMCWAVLFFGSFAVWALYVELAK
ncbi:MAG: Nramp family divalent metal transporter [Pirellulales bacterium]